MNQGIVISATADEVARNAAMLMSRAAANAIELRQSFTVALSGGSTPRRLYELLATPEWKTRLDWPRVHLFMGDERFVPADNPESNYRMVREALLSKIAIPESNVHRVLTELATASDAAAQYDQEIRNFFANEMSPGTMPRFDLVLLGLGTNGHTASLFPHCPALHETERLVTADFVEEVNAWRITFTVPLINRARAVAFVVTGANKAGVMRDIMIGDHDPERLPAQLIQPTEGSLTWIADHAAAARMPA